MGAECQITKETRKPSLKLPVHSLYLTEIVEFNSKKSIISRTGAELIQEGLNCSYTMASAVCRYSKRVKTNIIVRPIQLEPKGQDDTTGRDSVCSVCWMNKTGPALPWNRKM